jgi:P27 family predicted phage terminase small subunit
MGKRGPAPKPTALKILQGNPGKRPLNAREPLPQRGRPRCPTWLDREAKAKWKALVPELDRLGLLTVVDGDVLAAYCQAYAEFRQATETLRGEGRYISVGTQMQSHPAVAQQRSAWQHIKAFSALLGLDPSSRSKLAVPGEGGEVDEFESFLREKA